jgi:hypothetical protein
MIIPQAYWEAHKIAEEKARAKREDQAIKRWIRLVQGLRIRQRLQDQYASGTAEDQKQQEKQSTDPEEKAEGEEMGAPVRSCSIMRRSSDTSLHRRNPEAAIFFKRMILYRHIACQNTSTLRCRLNHFSTSKNK